MLADEPRDAAPVPERSASQERTVSLRRVHMRDDSLRHVPAFPAGSRGPVTEIDVLPVEPVALVESAQLGEHVSAKKKERAQHPLGFGRADGTMVQLVVSALA